MKKVINLIFILCFLCISTLYGFIPKSIIIFGDSLSDIGNVDRYTNGSTWLEVLSDKCQLPNLECSKLGGNNFAYGGAKSGNNDALDILDVGNQIQLYLNQNENKADPEVLYIVWVGGNDFLAKRNPLELIANIRLHMEDLIKAGARKFMVPNLPSLTHAPRGQELVRSIVDRLLSYCPKNFERVLVAIVNRLLYVTIDLYNLKLKGMISQIKYKKDIEVYYLDTFNLFNNMFENLGNFGFKERSELFYDPLHPSAKAHAVIGEVAHGMLLRDRSN